MSHPIANEIILQQLRAVESRSEIKSILAEHGLTKEDLQGEIPKMTAAEFASLLRHCFEFFDDEAMGFTDKPLRTGTFRMMCQATIGCQNIRRALLRIADFFRLLSDEFEFSLTEQGEEACFTAGFSPQHKKQESFFIVSFYVIVWRYMAWLMDAPVLLNRVHLRLADGELKPTLDPVFECPLFMGQQQNQMIFSSHYLSKPIKQNADTLSSFLANSPECLMSHFQPAQSYSARVKARLVDSEDFEHLTLESMAKEFTCSAQSLARKLRSEGHQFQQLKDKVRKSKTINLLLNSDLPISVISHQVGFSEEAVFYRTFKKWTGTTPKNYRQLHRL